MGPLGLVLESGAFMNGICTLIRHMEACSLSVLQHEDAMRRQSRKPASGPQQTLNLPTPWCWISQSSVLWDCCLCHPLYGNFL